MVIDLMVFINYKQNNQAKFILIVEFAYNNVKNTNINYRSFKFNYNYNFYILQKEDFNFYLKLKLIDKQMVKLKDLMTLYKKKFYHIQKLQKQVDVQYIRSKN